MTMQLKQMALADIRPYPNNPRINDGAVAAVAQSIAQCGYVSPIIVDEDMVILAGHTRHKALLSLGRKRCDVLICSGLTEDQRRKYRLLDNKTAEIAEWDMDLLVQELDGLDFGKIELDWGLPQIGEAQTEKSVEVREYVRAVPGTGQIEPEETEEYSEFVEKFKPKLTTDDCYTPENVYDCVRKWVLRNYNINGATVLRPFYPGGDYQAAEYPENSVVIDNPPFSILSKICRFYEERGIRFFLFAPALTLFSTASGTCNYLPVGVSITYHNGAQVNTSFVTNLGEWKIDTAPDLYQAVKAANDENIRDASAELPNYVYPTEVVTVSVYRLAKYGQRLRVRSEETVFVRSLDSQKEAGKAIFGAGFLISERAAAERAAAERAAAERAAAERAAAERAAADLSDAVQWALSERELNVIRGLGPESE